jgi:plastocyanin
MSNLTRDAGLVLGQSTGKRIGITLVACALVLGIVLTTLPILAPTARAQGQNVVTVPIRDFFFDPANITVEPGTTVMWVNEGTHPHTVTSDDGQFDSEALMPGDSFMVTFSGSGTLTYHCEIHDFMMGSVTVSDSGGEAAPAEEISTPAAPPDGGDMGMPMGSGY